MGQTASAQTSSVQAQIQLLMQQIASLQAQLAQLQAQQNIPPTWCHTFNVNLGYANSGLGEVGHLHTALTKENIPYTPDTGNTYGEATKSAVEKFQQNYGILQTGYVGPLTRTKLNSLYGCPTEVTPPPPPPPPTTQCTVDADCPQPNCGAVTNCVGSTNKCVSGQCVLSTTPPATCTPNWTCGWGACVNGYQSQVATDTNNCGVTTGNNIACTALARQCNVTPPTTCTSFTYSAWSTCSSSGQQTRTVASSSPSGCTGGSPITSQFCTYVPPATKCPTINCLTDNCPGKHLPDANGCVSCASPCPPVSTQPGITVTSPVGGESWVHGSTHTISWTSTGIKIVSIALGKTSSNAAPKVVAAGQPIVGAYSWTIPQDSVTGSDCYLRFMGADDSGNILVTKLSNSFNITLSGNEPAPAPTPALSVALGGGSIWETSTSGAIFAQVGSFRFTNTSALTPISILQLKIKKLGTIDPAAIKSLYLKVTFSGNGANSGNYGLKTSNIVDSSGYITFVPTSQSAGGLIYLPPSTYVDVKVQGVLSGSTGTTFGLRLESASDISTTATIQGSFPMGGSLLNHVLSQP